MLDLVFLQVGGKQEGAVKLDRRCRYSVQGPVGKTNIFSEDIETEARALRSLSSSVANVSSVKPEPGMAFFPEAFGDRLDGAINRIMYPSRVLAVSMYLPRYCKYARSWKLTGLDC